jgi:hypothetical protein
VNERWREMPPKSKNTTAVFGGTRVEVRAFRGPDAMRPTGKPNQIWAGIDAREALIVLDGQERWVALDQLADFAAQDR